MKANVMEFQSALMGTGLVQPVDVKGKSGDIEVLLRLVPGQEKGWLAIMDQLLQKLEGAPGDFHVCRRYVRRGGQMVFGYHVSLHMNSAKALNTAIAQCVEVLKLARPSLTPISAPAQRVEAAEAVQAPVRKERKPELKVIERRRDDDGNEIIVEEMALPHVRSEMNKPTHKGGRGATRTAASR